MNAVIISGYLAKEVTDNKHKSAKPVLRFLRKILAGPDGKGKVKPITIAMGDIYLTADEKEFSALQDELKDIKDVKVDKPTEAMHIYMREKARVEAASRVQQK